MGWVGGLVLGGAMVGEGGYLIAVWKARRKTFFLREDILWWHSMALFN